MSGIISFLPRSIFFHSFKNKFHCFENNNKNYFFFNLNKVMGCWSRLKLGSIFWAYMFSSLNNNTQSSDIIILTPSISYVWQLTYSQLVKCIYLFISFFLFVSNLCLCLCLLCFFVVLFYLKLFSVSKKSVSGENRSVCS